MGRFCLSKIEFPGLINSGIHHSRLRQCKQACSNSDMLKILMTTFGSYGDLNPFLGMARVLRNRGDEVTVATHAEYREQVERIGARFVPLKPGLEEVGPQESWAAQANHSVWGAEFIIRTLVLPYLEDGYRVIKATAPGHDLMISHMLTFATPLVSEELGIPWISTALQPSPFFSAYDPPILPAVSFLPRLKFLGPRILRLLMQLLSKPTEAWTAPVSEFRKKIGLAPVKKNLLIDGYSPTGTLAFFPAAFAPAQPDWPPNVKQIGFPLFDEETTAEISPGLQAFLASGPPPIVFTLGTAIVKMDTSYFEVAYQAVKTLGLRAVFLAGKNPRVPEAAKNDPMIHVSEYEPFSGVFPRALVNVHQCGIGTTSQALASGKPQVLVPFAHDQPDNARRVAALGLGVAIAARQLDVARLVHALRKVTEEESFASRAEEFGANLRLNRFDQQLVDAISQMLAIAKQTQVGHMTNASRVHS